MSDTKSDIKILALVGSLRAASFNRQIAELAAKVAPDGVTVTMFEGWGPAVLQRRHRHSDGGAGAGERVAGGRV